MFKVGLTGGIASGKTTVANFFIQNGITVIDADQVARELVKKGEPCLTKIHETFGNDILSPTGELDRALLRKLIFNDVTAKMKLEKILHPPIRHRMLEQSSNADSPYVIWSVPLLFESHMQTMVDRVLVVNTMYKTQIERLCERDNIDFDLAKKMINAQFSNEQRVKLADDIIDNNDEPSTLAKKVKYLHNQYLNLVISSK